MMKKHQKMLLKTRIAKFKSLPNAEVYLKERMTFEILDKIAYAESDIEFAKRMKEEKSKVFKNIKIN